MPIALLHETSIAAAKLALRARLPDVRSAHLTEALAVGLGFRTHAALLAAIATDSGLAPAIADTDDDAFSARLVGFGYRRPPRATLATLVRSDALPDRPYLEFRDRDRLANDKHFAHCDRWQRPMVMVRTARTYATVEWDCITANRPGKFPYGDDEGRSTLDEMIRLFQLRTHSAPGKPHFYAGVFTGWMYKLLPATAHQLAEDIFRILYDMLRAEQRNDAGLAA